MISRTGFALLCPLILYALCVFGPASLAIGREDTGPQAGIERADVPLLTADNDVVKLKADVIQDRLVVMNFVYTTCATACPIQLALFSRLQKQLGERLENQVRLVSLSIDPATDIPERLKQAALRHGAKPGWFWLTGAPVAVQATLKSLGVYSIDPTRHRPVILIGDGKCDHWRLISGFVSTDRILAELRKLEAQRHNGSTLCPR